MVESLNLQFLGGVFGVLNTQLKQRKKDKEEYKFSLSATFGELCHVFCYKVLSSMMEFQAVYVLQCISSEAFTVWIVRTVNNQDLSVDCNLMYHHFYFFYL